MTRRKLSRARRRYNAFRRRWPGYGRRAHGFEVVLQYHEPWVHAWGARDTRNRIAFMPYKNQAIFDSLPDPLL